MAAKLLEYFKHEIKMLQLVPSEGSRFEVMADDQPIFSKLETDRFPEYDEIKKSLQDL